MLDTFLQHKIKKPINVGATKLVKIGLTANKVTIFGLFTGLMIPVVFLFGYTKSAITVLIFTGFLDILDGTMARAQGGGTPRGAFMDICFDRVVESFFLVVMAFLYPQFLLGFVLLLASFFVSITVFLTSGLLVPKEHFKSFYYIPGLMERTETFILFGFMMAFPQYMMQFTIGGAILALVSSTIRFFQVLIFLKGQEKPTDTTDNI
ncbi:MAG: CDP-alcohol phosphatidyltransferase family protein [Brevinema sp.]